MNFFLYDGNANHRSYLNGYSISAQVIMRGNRSAGYGFVALSTAEAAQKAVEVLDKKQLDNRPIIVEIAKPADQKDSERRDRKPRGRRTGRRGSRAVPGEVTEAEANGEAKTEEDAAPAEGEALKPKKKKKKSTVSFTLLFSGESVIHRSLLEEAKG
jgi:RNA recognition motif-containing protein